MRRECIVVDNGSTDDTVKIAKQKGAKVLTMPDGTISALRNFGAKTAQGDYLAFIDADCAIDTNWLRCALPHFEDPTVGCAGSHPGIPKESTWVQEAWHLQNKRRAAMEDSRLAAFHEYAGEEKSVRGLRWIQRVAGHLRGRGFLLSTEAKLQDRLGQQYQIASISARRKRFRSFSEKSVGAARATWQDCYRTDSTGKKCRACCFLSII